MIIMLIVLIVYGFAPYGWDLIQQRETVRQTDLSFATVAKMVVPSIWLGPPQRALVVLGALFAPCMRRDRQLYQGIETDRRMERDLSGCCNRRDGSGCFQVPNNTSCQVYTVLSPLALQKSFSPSPCRIFSLISSLRMMMVQELSVGHHPSKWITLFFFE